MLNDLLPLLRDGTRFFIVVHLGPDGDAIGSQLALGRFLEKRGKQVTMVNSDDMPDNLAWLPGADAIEVFEGTLDQHRALAEADAVIVLDTNGEERLGKLGPMVRASEATKVLVDHHREPESWFDHYFVRESAAAAGELVYEIIDALAPELIDAEIATALYTAIMTDTGSFRYSSVTPRIHRIVADLLERGDIAPAPIHERIFDRRSMEGLRLLGGMLNRIRLHHDGQVAYSVVTQQMVRDTGASWSDKEGFVNYVLSIGGVKAALLFSETNDGAKISFRSEADVAVDEWARSFDGGGHRNAAGAYVKGRFEEVIERVIDAAPHFLDLELSQHASGEYRISEEDASYLETLMNIKKEQSSS